MTDAGFTEVILFIFLNLLVFWPKRWTRPEAIFLNVLGFPLNALYGFNLAAGETYTNAWIIGIVFVILSLFCLFRAVLILFGKQSDGGKDSAEGSRE